MEKDKIITEWLKKEEAVLYKKQEDHNGLGFSFAEYTVINENETYYFDTYEDLFCKASAEIK